MKIIELEIPELKVLVPDVHEDERGFFYESFVHKFFSDKMNIDVKFVQENHTLSYKGVLRGLHYQLPPYEQGKLIKVVEGEIYDVALDIREDSSFFGKWVGCYLSSENKKQLWIPPGFAHGFQVVSDTAEVLYKCSNYYSPEYERGILWNDEVIDIKWPEKNNAIISKKDREAVKFLESEKF